MCLAALAVLIQYNEFPATPNDYKEADDHIYPPWASEPTIVTHDSGTIGSRIEKRSVLAVVVDTLPEHSVE